MEEVALGVTNTGCPSLHSDFPSLQFSAFILVWKHINAHLLGAEEAQSALWVTQTWGPSCLETQPGAEPTGSVFATLQLIRQKRQEWGPQGLNENDNIYEQISTFYRTAFLDHLPFLSYDHINEKTPSEDPIFGICPLAAIGAVPGGPDGVRELAMECRGWKWPCESR